MNWPVNGTLTIDAGVIDRTADPLLTEKQIEANLHGQLTDIVGETYDVLAGMSGDFVGPDADGYLATIDGTITSATFGVEDLTGLSIGQQ